MEATNPYLNTAIGIELGPRVIQSLMTEADWSLLLDRFFHHEDCQLKGGYA